MQVNQKLTGYPSIDRPWLKYYSEEAINTPLPACTVYEYLWESNKNHLQNVAVNYFGRKITFQELFSGIEKASKAFAAIGVKQGDIVVVASVTTPETVYAFYGLNRIGAVANMVDPRTSVEGIRGYISEVNAKYVLTIDVAYSKIEKAVSDSAVQRIIITSPADSLPQPKKTLFNVANRLKGAVPKWSSICLRWKEFIRNGESTQAKYISYQRNTCCVIVHTGGTTGTPKGVMLSNDNVNALVLQSILTGIDMQREHTWMDIMPPFIAYGIGMGLHLPLVIGMQTILIPSFDAKKFDLLLDKHKPIHMVGVPSYWGTILESKRLKNRDLSYIIAPTVGGDTMDLELEKKANFFLQEHGCSYPITKGYGMTEVCAGITGTVDECNELGSVGIPFVFSTVSIFDVDSGKELPYNEIGEVCITGPSVMLGYYGNEQETQAIIQRHSDGKAWVHSGDMGYMSENGSLFILGRLKRMIIRYDGFKVFPTLIENALLTHSSVDTCCVVGIADPEHRQGKLPLVHLVLKAENRGDKDKVRQELTALCQKELPEYAQPVEYKFRDSLPLTPIGKVDYRALEGLEDKEG